MIGSQQVQGMTVRKAGVGGVMQRIQLKNVAFIPGKAPQQSPISSSTTLITSNEAKVFP